MSDYIKWMQKQLQDEQCSPGAIDGLHGPKTAAALLEFQRKTDLKQTGRADDMTLNVLRERQLRAERHPDEPPTKLVRGSHLPEVPVPWMRSALNVYSRHALNSDEETRAWLASPDHKLGALSDLPFCGDFIEAAMQPYLPREPLPADPYSMDSWLSFGRAISGPAIGAIGLTKSSVFFYAGEKISKVAALGVNKRGRVSIAPVVKTDVIAYRWPATYALAAVGPVIIDAFDGSNS